VILTGTLDDGVAGLAEIKRRGGLTVVQDPTTAHAPGMPNHAIQRVDVDFIVPLEEVASLLAEVAVSKRTTRPKSDAHHWTRSLADNGIRMAAELPASVVPGTPPDYQ